MKQVIECSEYDDIKVTSPMFLRNNTVSIKVGDVELVVYPDQAQEIYFGIARIYDEIEV